MKNILKLHFLTAMGYAHPLSVQPLEFWSVVANQKSKWIFRIASNYAPTPKYLFLLSNIYSNNRLKDICLWKFLHSCSRNYLTGGGGRQFSLLWDFFCDRVRQRRRRRQRLEMMKQHMFLFFFSYFFSCFDCHSIVFLTLHYWIYKQSFSIYFLCARIFLLLLKEI